MNAIDVHEWKCFVISRLFKIEPPAKRTIKSYNEGSVPYVTSSAVNNGVSSYLEPKKDEELEKGNCITVCPLDGTAFYQDVDFLGRGGAGSAISKLYNRKLTKYSALFICAIIKITSQRFDYSDALTSDNLKNFIIRLPVLHDTDGSILVDAEKEYSDEGFMPVWTYMENFMKSIETQSQKRIDLLKSISTL